VVKVLVDLSGGTVLDEETAEHTEAAHPEHLAVSSQQLSQASRNQFMWSRFPQFHSSRVWAAYLGIRASAVPFLLPKPRCRPIRRAAVRDRARARECMVTGLRMMRPSSTSLRIVWRELALEISFTSLGSSQILRFPQPTTDAARRFCVRRLTLLDNECQYMIPSGIVDAMRDMCAKRGCRHARGADLATRRGGRAQRRRICVAGDRRWCGELRFLHFDDLVCRRRVVGVEESSEVPFVVGSFSLVRGCQAALSHDRASAIFNLLNLMLTLLEIPVCSPCEHENL